MLAVIAAMIRIASRPSRKTIRAELVITVVRALALAGLGLSVLEGFVELEPGRPDVAGAGVVGDLGGEPVEAAGAVPHQSLDLERQTGIECL